MADRFEPQANLVTVFGGSGFVGRHVVKALANRGYRVRVACRRPDLAGFLRPLGTVGQIQPVQANLRYPDSVARVIDGADAVINLVGILFETGRQKFSSIQAEGARAVARAAKEEGVERFVQVSAIGADAASDIAYQRSKGEAEAAVFDAHPEANVLRPSIIFGPEDNFFNQFAGMAASLPALPLIGGGETRFQPVYVQDVAEVVARGVDGVLKPGAIYELGGPHVATFKECLELMLAIIKRDPMLLTIPFGLAKLQGRIMQLLPKPPLTYDQVRMLEQDNVVSDAAKADGRTLEGLGINPQSMDAILPTYLVRFRPYGQFSPDSVEN
ncbi:MAG: complex I NDUFA9 subunit family protein [Pseudomonadota bacterium]